MEVFMKGILRYLTVAVVVLMVIFLNFTMIESVHTHLHKIESAKTDKE